MLSTCALPLSPRSYLIQFIQLTPTHLISNTLYSLFLLPSLYTPLSHTYLLNGLGEGLPCSLCLGNGQDEFTAILQGGQAKSIAGAVCDAVCCIANIIIIAAVVVVSIAATTTAVVVVVVVGAVIAVASIADGQRGRAGCVAGGIRVVRRGGYGAILDEVSIGTYEYLFGANDLGGNTKKSR